MVTEASVEPDLVRPKPIMYLGICILCGCLVGLGLGVVKEHFEDKINTPELAVRETEAYILSVLPPLRGKERLTLADGRTNRRVSNAVNILKARIETLFGLDGAAELRSLMLSSFNHEENRSFVVRNLAASYAVTGKRVIIVAVGSTSRLEALGAYKSAKGYSDLLDGSATVDEVLVETDIPGVKGITQGQAQNALTVPHVEAVHQLLLDRADLVIYDGPSYVFPFDVQSLGSSVDATVLIVKPGTPKRNLLGAASDVLRTLSSRFLGIVVTATEGEQVGKDIVRFEE
jgi:Mrp family chromosome partitioning ATPase